MSAKAATGLSARERLLDAANELFYAEGVHTVGIDRVIERAGVAKASLYNTFGSKDELVRAYLEGRHARMAARITRHLDGQASARGKLLAVFEAQGELFAEPEFRRTAPSWTRPPTATGPGCGPCSPGSPARRAPPTPTGWACSCT